VKVFLAYEIDGPTRPARGLKISRTTGAEDKSRTFKPIPFRDGVYWLRLILLQGNDARQPGEDFNGNAQPALEFAASNLVAKTRKVVWEQFADDRPGRIMAAISERCGKASRMTKTISASRTLAHSVNRGMGGPIQQDMERFLNLKTPPGRLTAEQAACFLNSSSSIWPRRVVSVRR
jgi:hypothetical protein